MNTSRARINVDMARQIATDKAQSLLINFIVDKKIALLQNDFLEASHCWMFFRNKEIVIPPKYSLSDGAYIVSKTGCFRHIADFSDDPEKLEAYLQTMSDYFRKKGE